MQDIKHKPMFDDRFHELCVHVLSVDKAIHFCAIAHKSGYLLSLAINHNGRRHGVRARMRGDQEEPDPLALYFPSDIELEKYLYQSGIMWGIQKSWQKKLGNVRHFVSYYDAMPLVTIPVDNDHFLFLGIDSTKHPNVERIVLRKLFPLLQKAAPAVQRALS